MINLLCSENKLSTAWFGELLSDSSKMILGSQDLVRGQSVKQSIVENVEISQKYEHALHTLLGNDKQHKLIRILTTRLNVPSDSICNFPKKRKHNSVKSLLFIGEQAALTLR